MVHEWTPIITPHVNVSRHEEAQVKHGNHCMNVKSTSGINAASEMDSQDFSKPTKDFFLIFKKQNNKQKNFKFIIP